MRLSSLILAAEPTGNLDSTSTADILDLFDELHGAGRTVVLRPQAQDVGVRAGRHTRARAGPGHPDTARAPVAPHGGR